MIISYQTGNAYDGCMYPDCQLNYLVSKNMDMIDGHPFYEFEVENGEHILLCWEHTKAVVGVGWRVLKDGK